VGAPTEGVPTAGAGPKRAEAIIGRMLRGSWPSVQAGGEDRFVSKYSFIKYTLTIFYKYLISKSRSQSCILELCRSPKRLASVSQGSI
jgi:hypothetical protein